MTNEYFVPGPSVINFQVPGVEGSWLSVSRAYLDSKQPAFLGFLFMNSILQRVGSRQA